MKSPNLLSANDYKRISRALEERKEDALTMLSATINLPSALFQRAKTWLFGSNPTLSLSNNGVAMFTQERIAKQWRNLKTICGIYNIS